MSQSPDPHTVRTFTRDDLNDIRAAHDKATGFTRFVLTRFAAYTRYTEVSDARNRKVEPVEDPFQRTNAGYGQWRVPADWIHRLDATYVNDSQPTITVEHYVDADRGPGSVDQSVQVPLAFIFGDVEQDAEYATYLRLKAQYEPSAATVPVENDVVTRGAAQRLLDVLEPAQRPSLDEMLADKQVAERVYTSALKIVEKQFGGGIGFALDDVHKHAAALGLDRQPLPSVSKRQRSKKRLEAARYLWVQSRSAEEARTGKGEYLADPENREAAGQAYRDALRRLAEPYRPGLKDVRRQVHDSAKILGLTEDDLKAPKTGKTQPDSPYDNPRAGQPSPKPDSTEDADTVTTTLGYTLLNDLTSRLFGGGTETVQSPDAAQRAYEKVRAVLTLSGKDVFGEHTEQVLSVADDVASLLGMKKTK